MRGERADPEKCTRTSPFLTPGTSPAGSAKVRTTRVGALDADATCGMVTPSSSRRSIPSVSSVSAVTTKRHFDREPRDIFP